MSSNKLSVPKYLFEFILFYRLKTHVYIMCLFFFLSLNTNGQKEWAPIGAKWFYQKEEGMMPGKIGYILITSVKDSSIDNKPVKKLTVNHYKPDGNIVSYPNIFTFYDNGKAFYWEVNQFHLLYDFTAKEGSIWQIYNSRDNNNCGSDTLGSVIVDSTRNETIDGFNLECIYTSPYNNSIWQLGEKIAIPIGSLTYFLPIPAFCGIFDDFPFAAPLKCYEDPLIGLIHFDNFSACDFTTTSFEHQISRIEIQPNPFSSSFKVILNIPSQSQLYIEIYNDSGKRIYMEKVLNSNEIIELKHIKSGIYFILVRNNNSLICEKKIIKI